MYLIPILGCTHCFCKLPPNLELHGENKKYFIIIDRNDNAIIACCNSIVMFCETVHEISTLEPRKLYAAFESFRACADKNSAASACIIVERIWKIMWGFGIPYLNPNDLWSGY